MAACRQLFQIACQRLDTCVREDTSATQPAMASPPAGYARRSMFATTFLGHQGWLFQSDRAAILVDPLLCEEFGAAQQLEYRVFPPRALDLAKLPPLDAVVLSHEHDDHFDLPSLAKLSRKIPIHLSARSSTAAHQILREL